MLITTQGHNHSFVYGTFVTGHFPFLLGPESSEAEMPLEPEQVREWNQRLQHALGPDPSADGVHTTAMAIHDADGRIACQMVDEDDIDLDALKPHDARGRTESTSSTVSTTRSSSRSITGSTLPYSATCPPVMNICIMIVGTRGDVQPFIAIAQRLQNDGHRVRLATHAVYRDFVTENGVEFYPLGGDPKELAAYMVKTGGHIIPLQVKFYAHEVPRNMQMIEEILNSTWPAVSAPDPDAHGVGIAGKPFQAHAIISNPVTYGHVHVAERLGVPLHIMFPQPWVPTQAFPHPLSNMPYNGKPSKKNFLSYKLIDLLMWQGTEGMINEFRTEVLGLRKIRKGDGGRDILLDLNIPHAFMWSPALVPKPADWGKIYDVVGTVTLKEAAHKYAPTPDLEKFLGNDGGPIFVGFGSMVIEDPVRMTKMIIEAAKQANDVRVLIQSSWSDMAGGLVVPPNIFFLGNCPHDWLMPRVSAVIHHGGAGTTAAGLLAGKPTFIVPFFGDQPFWGRAVVDAGVGVEPCPILDLTAEKLRDAFTALRSQSLREKALKLRDVLMAEDGADEAVKCFYKHLPVKGMKCDIGDICGSIASMWSVSDHIKLCDRCTFTIATRPENYAKKFVPYHCVDYSARGPKSCISGAASGAGAFIHELGGAFKDVIVQPAKGFRADGAKGAVIGVAKGISGLIIRPVHGVALFADHVAAGHVNRFKQEGSRTKGSVFDHQLMASIGFETGLVNTYSANMTLEEADAFKKDGKKNLTRTILLRLTPEERDKYQARFKDIVKLRKQQSSFNEEVWSVESPRTSSLSDSFSSRSSESLISPPRAPIEVNSVSIGSTGCVEMNFDVACEGDDCVDQDTINAWKAFSEAQEKIEEQKLKDLQQTLIPKMNICLAASGTWEANVKQFIAIGLRLAQDGHRVRIAANEEFREAVIIRGLEFYPLGGPLNNMQDFVRFLNESQKHTGFFHRHPNEKPVLAALKDQIFSLWPAVHGTDPHGAGHNIPGEHFRADLLVCHPWVFGHAEVAQRLGIPLHCVSLVPLSPTFAFPHLLSSYLNDGKQDEKLVMKETNLLSYGVVDTLVWRMLADTLDQFRAFIGITGHSDWPNPIYKWETPHTYLWNSSLLEKPLDWGSEIVVAGHITLDDDVERNYERQFKLPRSFTDFTLESGSPVVYFGLSQGDLKKSDVTKLLVSIDEAARTTHVQVIFQIRDGPSRPTNVQYHTENVYEVEKRVPYSLILRKVRATIHWGEFFAVSEGLASGRPTCVCPRLPTQQCGVRVLVNAGVGVPSINFHSYTVNDLVSTFQQLLHPDIQVRAQEYAKTFDYKESLERTVESIYANLPLPAMICDLDNSKIAHVYDPYNELKLSLEAYLAIQPLQGHDPREDLRYKPLRYSKKHPPKYALRGIRGDVNRELKPKRGLDAIGLALSAMKSANSIGPSAMPSRGLERHISYAPVVVERPLFWQTEADEAMARDAIFSAYDRLIEKQDANSRSNGTRKPSHSL